MQIGSQSVVSRWILVQAIAAHGSGGLVIVQVERIVERGSLKPRDVHLPAALVVKVLLAVTSFGRSYPLSPPLPLSRFPIFKQCLHLDRQSLPVSRHG